MEVTQQTAPPAAEKTFSELNLSDEVRRALDEIGYINPTPVQLATYDLAVSGRDIIVQARTGTGKTAAFALPLVDRIVRPNQGVQVLVLAPTRELALQSAKEIQRIGKYKGLRTTAIYGGAPMGRQIDELAAGAQIVSGTPGRVLDHLRRRTLDPSGLRALVLDEMDEMLSMGFARELNAILELIPDQNRRQTMCFSATVDGDIRRHAERYMKDPQMVSLSSDAVGAEAITHFVYNVSGSDRTGDLIKVLEVEDPESALIFCNMRSETEQVAGGLKQAGFDADWLNGDLPQRDREKVMSRTRAGKLRYLVATDVAARGIDVSHLTHVINYSFPESAAVYVHRTGRTGRAGRTGCAISLVAPQELGRLYYLRLEYKISPVERSLPSKGELRTRQEADRVTMLNDAFAGAPKPADLALARRLLTHPEVERIVGGLLHTFFGTQGEAVDEQAAAARRARAPRAVLASSQTTDEDDDARWEEPGEPAEREREPERARDDRGGSNEARSRGGRYDRGERRDRPDRGEQRGRTASPDRLDRPERQDRPQGQDRPERQDRPQSQDRPERQDRPQSQDRPERQDRPQSQDRPERRDRPAPKARAADGEPAQALDDTEAPDTAAGDGGEGAADLANAAMLYLDIGRKDGARVSEIARMMREVGELRRSEVGRIRIRDRHTFVEVPEDKVEVLLAKLKGHNVNEKALSPERAKATRT